MVILPHTATGSESAEKPQASVPFCALDTSFLSCQNGNGPRPTCAQALEAALYADAVVLGGGLSSAIFDSLLHLLVGRYKDRLPVLAVDARLGPIARGEERLGYASLCSVDKEESAAAARDVSYCLSVAEETRAPFVVLDLGNLQELRPIWEKLKRRFLRGDLLLDQEPARQFMAARDSLGVPHLAACFRVMTTVLKRAEQIGLTVLLRNPRCPFAMPTTPELMAILEEFRGAPLQPMLDMPRAFFCSMIQCFRLRDIMTAFAGGPVCHLGDACGTVGGLIPGQGEIDLSSVVRYLKQQKHSVRPYFDPWSSLDVREVQAACAAIKLLIQSA